jgi:two-component system, cell cycle response regulator DivK
VNNIIVVEDDPFSQEFYKYLLKREGFTPLIIEEGDLLFKQLKTESISLIIMDINLKNTYLNNEKVDGVILSKMVKENPAYSKVPILLVTAYSLATDRPGFFKESLAEDYITKPVLDYNLLLRKIKNLVEG